MQNHDDLPRLLQSFFSQRLIAQRKASPHTIAAYRDTFRLLLQFAQRRLHKTPSQLGLEDLDASLIGAFLDDLEKSRHNGARSRNLRLTAVRSFFRYAALESPTHAGLIQRVLAIPSQRQPRALVAFLNRPEIDALLAAPNRQTWLGRRDHAFLLTALQTGLRLSEMTALRHQDIWLDTVARMSVASEKDARNVVLRWPSRQLWCSKPGFGNKAEMMAKLCFPASAAAAF
jgi:site-specific recombinase XerD